MATITITLTDTPDGGVAVHTVAAPPYVRALTPAQRAALKLAQGVAISAAANDRAHRIATIAAQELLQTEGTPTDAPDEYTLALCQVDEHMRECIEHLCWSGEAASHETEGGAIVVQLSEYPRSTPQ